MTVVLYLRGAFCPDCRPWPAPPTPDPTRTVAGLRTRPVTGFSPVPYGRATSDPLGRTIPPHANAGMLPRYACPDCSPRRPQPVKHKGDHT